MEQKYLSEQQRSTTFCYLPPLKIDRYHATQNPSNSPWKLDARQVHQWQNFADTVRESTRMYLGKGQTVTSNPPGEFHIVGNEAGVQGRFVQNISQVMNPIFTSLGLAAQVTDFEIETHGNGIKGKAIKKGMGKNDCTPISS
jgi:hypothetical protein